MADATVGQPFCWMPPFGCQPRRSTVLLSPSGPALWALSFASFGSKLLGFVRHNFKELFKNCHSKKGYDIAKRNIIINLSKA
jgi:hypothetical protein